MPDLTSAAARDLVIDDTPAPREVAGPEAVGALDRRSRPARAPLVFPVPDAAPAPPVDREASDPLRHTQAWPARTFDRAAGAAAASAGRRYALAVGAAAAALALTAPVAAVVRPYPTALLVVAVMVSGAVGGLGPGLVTAGLCALLADYVLAVPRFTWGFDTGADAGQLALFTVTAFGVSALSARLGRARARVAALAGALAEQNAELAGANAALRRAAAALEERAAAADRARAAAEASDAALRLAQAAANVGTWTVDLVQGRVTWSDQYYHLHGLDPAVHPPAQAVWEASIHPDDRARVLALVRDAIADPDGRYAAGYGVEYRIVRPDGSVRWILGRGRVTRDPATGAAAGIIGANFDITERRAAEAEAVAQRQAAERANAAKSQFLATMSHELRTPLNAIQGHVQLLELGLHGPVTDAQREAFGRVTRAQQHLLGLINDVLNYAKLEAGKVEYDLRAVPAGEVVAGVVAMIEPQLAAKGLALAVDVPGPADGGAPVCVWADPEKLAQVLLNLLSNAVKFTPAERADGRRGEVRVELAAGAPDGFARLRVRDTGIGVPADKLAGIFEPFVQVRSGYARAAEGTGLGLAISRDLARGMGGDLTAESVEGEGSTFTVALRRAPAPGGA